MQNSTIIRLTVMLSLGLGFPAAAENLALRQTASTPSFARETGGKILLAQSNLRTPATINGAIDSNSLVLSEDNSYYNTHTFEGKAGEQIVIELSSSEFDSYLILLDPENKKIADDDDGGSGQNARIAVTLPTTGTYTIFANSYQAGETGNYILHLRANTAENLVLAEEERLRQQVEQLYEQGQYAEAIPLAQRDLAMWEKKLGLNHPNVAIRLNNLANLYLRMGNFATAEPLHRRAIQIWEKNLGSDHPDLALRLNELAELYRVMENSAAAEPFYKQALVIWEKNLGSDHPDLAPRLTNLANLYRDMGNYAAAEPLYQRALTITEKALGSDHPDVALRLSDLATLYEMMRNYEAAKPLLQRALAISETAYPPDHPSHVNITHTLTNLARLYQYMGNYEAAEPLFQRALAIRETAYPPDHPFYIYITSELTQLAKLYQAMGNYEAAEPLFQRALAIAEKVYGPNHALLTFHYRNLAAFYRARGDVARTSDFLQRGTNIEDDLSAASASGSSESEQLKFMGYLFVTTYRAISFNLRTAPNDSEATRLALTNLLRRKSFVLDTLTTNLNLLRQNLTPENQVLLDKLATTRRQLSALIYNKPETLPIEQYRQQVMALETELEKLETELSRSSAEFRVASEPVTIEAVQQLIPKDTALVEIALYYPLNPKAKRSEQWGKPRYAAYILKSSGEPVAIDLGEAAAIDEAVFKFRQGLVSHHRRDLAKNTGRSLDALVMEPIRAKLGNTKNLLISPDGQLNLIPFAALTDENEQYLVENYRITYLTSGRDLISLALDTTPQQPPVVVANPNYDFVDRDAIAALSRGANTPTNLRSGEINNLTFAPLPGTKAEAEAIVPLLNNPTVLTQTRATENALKRVKAPSILHIATHGFFLDVDLFVYPEEDEPKSAARLENPLVRSGLALAGFNNRQSDDEDGVLTALETAQLNLRGTQLVVLSACETGLGETVNGEGVYGLRRAITIAGAKSQVMSLWAVSDEGTKEWMIRYYQRVLQGEERGEALRQVQLEMLREEKYEHPYFWAAFLPAGAWDALDNW